MGRNAIKTGTLMKQVTLWLDPGDIVRIHAHVGKRKGSEYVRAAIAEKLERDGVLPLEAAEMAIEPQRKAPPPHP